MSCDMQETREKHVQKSHVIKRIYIESCHFDIVFYKTFRKYHKTQVRLL